MSIQDACYALGPWQFEGATVAQDWAGVDINTRWALIDGKLDDNDAKLGRLVMFEALAVGDASRAEALWFGFSKIQTGDKREGIRRDFRDCLDADPRRLYNLARRINQQPEV